MGALLTTALSACGNTSSTEPSLDFLPRGDTTIRANASYRSVAIPAGVTVTAGHLNLTVTQDFELAGTLRALCGVVKIQVEGAVRITGTIDNSCPVRGDSGGSVTLTGRSAWSLVDASITSSGDITISNTGAAAPCEAVRTRIGTSPAGREQARDSIPTGAEGRAGANRVLSCGGSLLLNGATIIAGHGGNGGAGTSSTSTPALGGNGGAPGGIILEATTDIGLQGTVDLTSGNGGNGGNATATSPNGTPGGNATATGGRGADLIPIGIAAPIVVHAGSVVHQAGTLFLRLGNAGDGGNALATAGSGIPGNPGGAGGSADGRGGAGGNVVIYQFLGTTVSLDGQLVPSGGTGGAGGNASCKGGLGGPASVPGIGGGRGGDMHCVGGVGGNGILAGGSLPDPSPGGHGGNAEVSGGGNGGVGSGNCPSSMGGGGGAGGNVTADWGEGGDGFPPGAHGLVSIVTAGNGGRGGNGAPPGTGGAGGANLSTSGAIALLTDSFAAGLAGTLCPAGAGEASFADAVGFAHQRAISPSRKVRGGTR